MSGFEPAVVLKWKAPPASVRPVRVRAFSLKDREYFRMDTAVPAKYGGYRWPTEIVASVGLKREEIGLVAWTTLPGPGGSAREVYLPLHAGRAAAVLPPEMRSTSMMMAIIGCFTWTGAARRCGRG